MTPAVLQLQHMGLQWGALSNKTLVAAYTLSIKHSRTEHSNIGQPLNLLPDYLWHFIFITITFPGLTHPHPCLSGIPYAYPYLSWTNIKQELLRREPRKEKKQAENQRSLRRCITMGGLESCT